MGNDYENPCSDINKRVLYYPTIEDHFSEQELTTLYKPKGDEDGDFVYAHYDRYSFVYGL